MPSITILGATGRIGHAAALAFSAAGWTVTSFGRSNRKPVRGVTFVAGDAADAAAVRDATAGADAVFYGLNLPYHKWFGGALEAQLETVLGAIAGRGQTLLVPVSVYNYGADQAVLTPETPQRPQTPRGEIRVRMEERLRRAAAAGDVRAIVVRAGDFYGPTGGDDWFDLVILREAAKGKIALPTRKPVRHSWAYLPDLAEAFVALAARRTEFAAYESFHFAGHAVTAGQLFAAVEQAAGRPMQATGFPWGMLTAVGLVNPLVRELVKMRYLWEHEMVLADPWLEAILGPDFGTPYEAAIAATVAPAFAKVAA